MTLSRRSFFKRTVGAVVTATVAGVVKVNGEMINATHLYMGGTGRGKSTMVLIRAINWAQTHPNSNSIVMFKDHIQLLNAANSINHPHVDDPLAQIRYIKHTPKFILTNNSNVFLVAATNHQKVQSLEVNAVFTHDVPITARNTAFTRARLTPRVLEWS